MQRNQPNNDDNVEILNLIIECDSSLIRLLQDIQDISFGADGSYLEKIYEYARLSFNISEISRILNQPSDTHLDEIEIFLLRCHDEILDTPHLSYNKNSQHPFTKLCYKIAYMLEISMENNKPAYQYLIPSLLASYNHNMLENLSELSLDQFVLCENHEYGLPVIMLDAYIQATNDEDRELTLWNPYLKINRGEKGISLSEASLSNLINHSKESREYYQAYRNTQEKNHGAIGKALKELCSGLRNGGALHGGGTSDQAGDASGKALVMFEEYLKTMDEISRKLVLSLTAHKKSTTLGQIINSLHNGLCVYQGSDAIVG